MFNLLFIKVGILCTFHSLYIFDINDNLVLILPINECFGEIFTMHKGIIPTFKRFYTSLCNKFNFHSFLQSNLLHYYRYLACSKHDVSIYRRKSFPIGTIKSLSCPVLHPYKSVRFIRS